MWLFQNFIFVLETNQQTQKSERSLLLRKHTRLMLQCLFGVQQYW